MAALTPACDWLRPSRPGSGQGFPPSTQQYFSLRRLSDDSDAFKGLAHISQHVMVPSEGQSPAAAVGLRYISAPQKCILFKTNSLFSVNPSEDLLPVNSASDSVSLELFFVFWWEYRGVFFVFCDLTLNIHLPAAQVEVLAAGWEKRTLCLPITDFSFHFSAYCSLPLSERRI